MCLTPDRSTCRQRTPSPVVLEWASKILTELGREKSLSLPRAEPRTSVGTLIETVEWERRGVTKEGRKRGRKREIT